MSKDCLWCDCPDAELQVLGSEINLDLCDYEEFDVQILWQITTSDAGKNRGDGRCIDALIVDEYAAEMGRGDVFPSIIIVRHKNTIMVISGYHRVHAARKAGRKTIRALVVPSGSLSPTQIKLLMLELNDVNGKGVDIEELYSTATRMVLDRELSAKDATRRFKRISDSTLKEHIRRERVRRAYAGKDIHLEEVPAKCLDALHSVSKTSEATREAMARVLAEIGGKSGVVPQFQELCREVQQIPTEQQQLAQVREFRDTMLSTANRRGAKVSDDADLLLRYTERLQKHIRKMGSLNGLTEDAFEKFTSLWAPLSGMATELICKRGKHG